jgi:hypothetical protein
VFGFTQLDPFEINLCFYNTNTNFIDKFIHETNDLQVRKSKANIIADNVKIKNLHKTKEREILDHITIVAFIS